LALEALLLALEDHHRPLVASVVSHLVGFLEHLPRDLLAVEDPLEDLVSSSVLMTFPRWNVN
jgi:hypothetical protein